MRGKMIMNNIFPKREKVTLNKYGGWAEDREGVVITIFRKGGASNYHITQKSFLKFVFKSFKKEIRKQIPKLIAEEI